jgi:hypothetical protein
MTGGQTRHITVPYHDGGVQITCVYAINEEVLRKLDRKRLWLGRHMTHPTGKDLRDWLEKKGCKLDRSNGPALVGRKDDGSTLEKYYRDGKLHREDGPAIVGRCTDGSMFETYFLDGVEYLKQEYYAKTKRPEPNAPKTPPAPGPA